VNPEGRFRVYFFPSTKRRRPVAPSIEGPIDVSPQEARYDEGRLALLEEYFARAIQSGRLQGAAFLMARRGKVFAHRALGRLNPAKDSPPLRPDSILDVASLTKPFTAAAVMKLVEDGVLWLEQPVKTLIPELDNPIHGGIHLWHLLTHTSGLPPDAGYLCEPYSHPWFDFWKKGEDWLRKGVLVGAPVGRPGESWNYCSKGFVLLAEVVARASGMHFGDYLHQKVFQPLGLDRTFYGVPESLGGEVAWAVEWQREKSLNIRKRESPDGGGGVSSTLHDLFKFAQCFLNGGEYGGRRILSRKTVEEMTRNQLSGVPAFHWGKHLRDFRHGLGWGFFSDGSIAGPATYCHEGWGWSTLYVDPVEQFVYAHFIPDGRDFDPDVQVKPRTIAFSGIR
jgi:CubicO group peptidase (beta-lactamase class C family)